VPRGLLGLLGLLGLFKLLGLLGIGGRRDRRERGKEAGEEKEREGRERKKKEREGRGKGASNRGEVPGTRKGRFSVSCACISCCVASSTFMVKLKYLCEVKISFRS
jgi:hypothetical protein